MSVVVVVEGEDLDLVRRCGRCKGEAREEEKQNTRPQITNTFEWLKERVYLLAFANHLLDFQNIKRNSIREVLIDNIIICPVSRRTQSTSSPPHLNSWKERMRFEYDSIERARTSLAHRTSPNYESEIGFCSYTQFSMSRSYSPSWLMQLHERCLKQARPKPELYKPFHLRQFYGLRLL